MKQILSKIGDYEKGDYVIHQISGVSIFQGFNTISVGKYSKEFIVLEYSNSDKLYVPVEQCDLISKYTSGNASAIRLDKLGGNSWKIRKKAVRKKIKLAAEQLVKIAAERELKKAIILEKDEEKYNEFCEEFPYKETIDQLQAIKDTTEDIGKKKPMDRLICGDVGFGKTEIALRTACIAVLGKTKTQVAIVVPSTLLVIQHEKLFADRFFAFFTKVASISRLNSKAKSEEIKKDLKEGKIDIIIGTHAILQKDIEFKKLGLLIIDEEHHFGVLQKEKIKKINQNVHILSLSATPIPRTLHLSLSGIKDLTLISTPPTKRKAILTTIESFSKSLLNTAITQELSRGGKILLVTPRIKYIAELEYCLKQIAPQLKYTMLHGQLTPETIRERMNLFNIGDIELLICTQIVESGLDIENVNTIIIDRANMFGLAQLYQLRGRVGRRDKQAYAYITHKKGIKLTNDALKRLEVMRSLEELGDGFKVANADMDIRGYGNLLGEEQAGHIKDVGIELYQKMLGHEIDKIKNNNTLNFESDFIANINLGCSALIPESYISDFKDRLNLYKKISDITEEQEISEFYLYLTEHFGEVPEEVKNLVYLIIIKKLAQKSFVKTIDYKNHICYFTFHENTTNDINKVIELIKDEKTMLSFASENKLLLRIKSDDDKFTNIIEILKKI
ncbi:MAG: transcription-repair coupling factor (superfamily II helicase) [Candidatus Midichloriaceae bacterium]